MPDTGEQPTIDILLATYNGAEFVCEQIESLFAQTYSNWRVLARDDGSTDDTAAILRRYAERHADRFVLISDDDGNLGCTGNFNRLMEVSTAHYLALCDQDDVWLAHKLSACMDRMRAMEREHSSVTPLLVHTDLRTVDHALKTIGPSFWSYQGLNPADANDFGRLLIRNVVTGCSMLINRSLKEQALPIPAGAKVHDWWIALVAAAFGALGSVPTPTALYRQHGSNTTGAKAAGGWRFVVRACDFITDISDSRSRLLETWRQAEAFRARYQEALGPRDRRILDDALTIPEAGIPTRIFRALKYGKLPPHGLYWMAFALFARGAGHEISGTPLPAGGNSGGDGATR